MKKLFLPIVLLLIGTGGGIGAGIMFKPGADQSLPTDGELTVNGAPCGDPVAEHVMEGSESAFSTNPITTETGTEFAEFSQQFVVPVVENEKIAAMMVLTLGVEVPDGQIDAVFGSEPRLRDSMLQDMFTHANIGGFSDNFTEAGKMRMLRQDLLQSARTVLGNTALDVLILDLVRQDI